MTNSSSSRLIRAYIVDDDPASVQVLRQQLEKNYSVEVVGTATNTDQALVEIDESQPDLLFLDVELPVMSGLEFCSVLQQCLKPTTKVVFYSAHERYLIDALRQSAFDYLLKPLDPAELSKVMTRYYEHRLSSLSSLSPATAVQRPQILVMSGVGEHVVLRAEDIVFFRFVAERRLWEVCCQDRATYTLRRKTTGEDILSYSPSFVQIHKRHIVNVSYIRVILENQCLLTAPLDDISELHISKNFRRDLLNAFYNL